MPRLLYSFSSVYMGSRTLLQAALQYKNFNHTMFLLLLSCYRDHFSFPQIFGLMYATSTAVADICDVGCILSGVCATVLIYEASAAPR
jgi:hypothetical protein